MVASVLVTVQYAVMISRD